MTRKKKKNEKKQKERERKIRKKFSLRVERNKGRGCYLQLK
jgi:hypothetical protein